jgi:AcrR family transcriptional regulator
MATGKATRQAIVTAAAQLFAERGYGAVGIDDIGAALGVSGPAVYHWFDGKEAVLVAVLESTARQVADLLAPPPGPMTAAEAEALVSRAVAASLDHRAGLATLFRELPRATGSSPHVQEDVDRLSRYAGVVLEALNPGLDPVAASVRGAAAQGTLFAVAVHGSGVGRPRLDEMLGASTVAILRARPPKPAPKPDPPGRRPAAAPRWRPQPGRRDTILAAAVGLFRRHGFHAVSVTQVGETAGMSGPAVYRYYRNKADILADAHDRLGRRLVAAAEVALAPATSARDGARRLARSYCQVAADHTDLVVVAVSEDGSIDPSPAWRDLRDLWSRVVAEARPDLRPAEIAFLVATGFSLMDHALPVVEHHPDHRPDVATVAAKHLMSG